MTIHTYVEKQRDEKLGAYKSIERNIKIKNDIGSLLQENSIVYLVGNGPMSLIEKILSSKYLDDFLIEGGLNNFYENCPGGIWRNDIDNIVMNEKYKDDPRYIGKHSAVRQKQSEIDFFKNFDQAIVSTGYAVTDIHNLINNFRSYRREKANEYRVIQGDSYGVGLSTADRNKISDLKNQISERHTNLEKEIIPIYIQLRKMGYSHSDLVA